MDDVERCAEKEENKLYETTEMVYTACVEWFHDWIQGGVLRLRDEWDFTQWMEGEMKAATECFLTYAFHTARARNDAIQILRALYYEYFLFEQARAARALPQNIAAVARLLALPQTTQKSAAWHAEARDLLTAHEFGAVCYGTPAKRNMVLAKKCSPELVIAEDELSSRHVFVAGEEGLSALKWGWRYESVARQLFERIVAEGNVDDTLGRIRHPSLPRLAASPDGLITTGPRAGRLVEIKCPISRELSGHIPIDYYCQMQLQAEVCDVDAVEYVEVRIAPLSVSRDIDIAAAVPWIGKICVTGASEETTPDQYIYEYSPLFPATAAGYDDALAWTPTNPCVHESSMWFVKDWFTKTVERNRDWWSEVGNPAYEEFWRDVIAARAEGRFRPQSAFVDSDSTEFQEAPKTAWAGVDSE